MMFSEDGSERPTIKQVKEHPWMAKKEKDKNFIRSALLTKKQKKTH